MNQLLIWRTATGFFFILSVVLAVALWRKDEHHFAHVANGPAYLMMDTTTGKLCLGTPKPQVDFRPDNATPEQKAAADLPHCEELK